LPTINVGKKSTNLKLISITETTGTATLSIAKSKMMRESADQNVIINDTREILFGLYLLLGSESME